MECPPCPKAGATPHRRSWVLFTGSARHSMHAPTRMSRLCTESPSSQLASPRGGATAPPSCPASEAARVPLRLTSSQQHLWCRAAPLSPLRHSAAAHAPSTARATIGASPSPQNRPYASHTPRPLRQQRVVTRERYPYARTAWPRSRRLAAHDYLSRPWSAMPRRR